MAASNHRTPRRRKLGKECVVVIPKGSTSAAVVRQSRFSTPRLVFFVIFFFSPRLHSRKKSSSSYARTVYCIKRLRSLYVTFLGEIIIFCSLRRTQCEEKHEKINTYVRDSNVETRALILSPVKYSTFTRAITLGWMGCAPGCPSLSLESTSSIPSLESPSRDSLSTIFAVFGALPSLVNMVQGLYDSRYRGPDGVCRAGCTSQPHTTSSAAGAVCTIPTYEYMYLAYSRRTYVYQVPHAYDTWYT